MANPTNPATDPAKRPRRLKVETVIVAVLIAVVFVAGILYLRNLNPSHYKYGQLNSYKLPGLAAGSGMTFNKPKEFEPGNLSVTKNSIILVHNKTLSNKKIITLGYMAAATAYDTSRSQHTQIFFDQVNKSMTQPSDAYYKIYRQTLSQFVSQNVSSRFKITLGSSKSYTEGNLQHAWVTGFTGVDEKPGSKSKPAKLQGEVIMAIGQSTYYYFMASAVNDNWNSNNNIWNQVNGSIKIDQ